MRHGRTIQTPYSDTQAKARDESATQIMKQLQVPEDELRHALGRAWDAGYWAKAEEIEILAAALLEQKLGKKGVG